MVLVVIGEIRRAIVITKENVTIDDWNNGAVLACPYLRFICGTWLALNEFPCDKHTESDICRPCHNRGRISDKKVIVVSDTKGGV